jgi:uncharacterized protein (TIGR01777 family)
MVDHQFEKTSPVAASAEDLFAWHSRPGALPRLSPPWQQVRLLAGSTGLREGSRVVLELASGPLRKTWTAEHRNVRPGRGFEDIQIEGPFAHWHHSHEFHPLDAHRCELRDRISYRLPGGAVGNLLGQRFVSSQLQRVFTYRHSTTADDLRLLSGSTGLVGSALAHLLTTAGHEVLPMIRGGSVHNRSHPTWNTRQGVLNPEALEGVDAVVHLAGESVSEGRWSRRKKERIRDSRIQGTSRLVQSLARLDDPPRALISASAVGFYGHRNDEVLDEASPRGDGFLAEVSEAWEAAAQKATDSDIRVVNARFGIVLSPAGGALDKMLPLFRLGAGGVLGGGSQWMSWISLDDAISALLHSLMCEELQGPLNVTAPQPVDNREMTRVLARVLRRPAVARVPSLAARIAFGEMAEEMLLSSSQVLPKRLSESGYEFRHPDLEAALRHLLGRTDP